MMAASAEPQSRPVVEPYPPARVGWTATFILFALVVLSVLDRNILTLLVRPIKADLGISDVEFSLLYGLGFSLSYAAAAMPAGWLVDRIDRRLVVFLGVSIWSIATAFTGLARSYQALFAARAAVGAGEAALSPAQQSMLTDLFPRDRLSLPLAVSSLGLKVGSGAALMIGGALSALLPPTSTFELPILGALKGWQLIFLAVGLPGLLLAALIFLTREPKRRDLSASTPTPGFIDYFAFLLKNLRFYIGHHLGQMLFVAVIVGLTAWVPSYFVRVHDWSEAHTGVSLGAAMLWGSVIGLPLHGFITDKLFARGMLDIHMRYSMLAALIAIPVGASIFLVSDANLACFLLGVFFFVTCVYASLPTVSVQALLPGNMRGKAASIMLIVIGSGGTTLGPWAVAYLTEHYFHADAEIGRAIVLVIVAGLALVAAFFALTLKPTRARMAAAELNHPV